MIEKALDPIQTGSSSAAFRTFGGVYRAALLVRWCGLVCSPAWLPHRAPVPEHQDIAGMDLGPGQERLDVGSGRPDGSRERPPYPGKVGLGEAGAGQVRTGEVVQSAAGERLRQSIRRGDAQAGGQALHADPVHGPGALSHLAQSAADRAADTADLAGWRALAEALGQGVGAAEAGADVTGEF